MTVPFQRSRCQVIDRPEDDPDNRFTTGGIAPIMRQDKG